MKSKPNSMKSHGSELQLYRQCQPKLKAKQYFYGFLFVFRLSGSKDQNMSEQSHQFVGSWSQVVSPTLTKED